MFMIAKRKPAPAKAKREVHPACSILGDKLGRKHWARIYVAYHMDGTVRVKLYAVHPANTETFKRRGLRALRAAGYNGVTGKVLPGAHGSRSSVAFYFEA